MSTSPGHQKWPDHKITEHRVDERLTVEVDGEVIADSSDVIRLDEDRYPPRYYFPRSDVKLDKFVRSETTTECPFKGTAHHFSLNLDQRKFQDAAWSYEDPYDEHRDLKDRLAFYDDKIPEIHVRAAA